ncbi:uroporphyrinogen-III synthase [Maritimibacter sp. DP1N21-5]|uniref:uroporphyrinogen-III synthase n=1 Tax=Maritimibacter sp. DP1N21-5 TaxID=2836867 RepID=UPI001C46C37D|nr:uroporphyrinogen-III synthase [Maritimibacter sp. DP1N21-5]MBV7410959.1 uroporphyrinogen-III synthase [Maritimibacter sp. DP1N21-5]
MTKAPTLVLTRPAAQSAQVADRVSRLLPAARILTSPVLEIMATGAPVDLSAYRGVILTSQNAAPFLPSLAGVPAYVVGARTAAGCGADVRLIAKDADDLVSRLDAEGPLLHPHGAVTVGDIAKRLSSAGIETHDAVVYDQRALDLSAHTVETLMGDEPAVLPLWSPRSATLVGTQVPALGLSVQVIALSPAVARAWLEATGRDCEVCARPDGDEMFARIVAALSGEVA